MKNKTLELSPAKIKTSLSKYVVGQDSAKDALSVAGFYQFVRLLRAYDTGIKDPAKNIAKQNLILIGPSGCGKTHLVSTLGKVLELPVIKISAKDVTNTGYVGMPLIDHIAEQRSALKKSWAPLFLDYAIVFIDEIDKICIDTKSGSDWNKGLQHSFLTAVEGSVITATRYNKRMEESEDINTHGMLFICGGSFQDLRDEKARKKNTTVGMEVKSRKSDRFSMKLTHEDLIDYGLNRELAGRLPILTHVNRLTKPELRQALLGVKNSPLSSYQGLMDWVSQFGESSSVALSEQEIKKIVNKAYKSNLGARALSLALYETLKPKLKGLSLRMEEE